MDNTKRSFNPMFIIVAVAQAAAVVGQYFILGALTSDRVLQVVYAGGLGLAPAALFGMALAVSPIESKVTSLLAWTPGGLLVMAGSIIMLVTLASEVPILRANGWDAPGALIMVIGTQLPASLFCSWFSVRVLKSLMDETRYALWMESTRRLVKLTLQIEMMRTVQDALASFQYVASGSRYQGAVKAALADVELRVHNTTEAVEQLCDTQAKFTTDSSQRDVFTKVRGQLQTLPVYQQPAKPAEETSWLDGYLF